MSDEMLEITVKLIPFGDYSNDKHLAKIIIINDGTGTREKGNYIIKYLGTSESFGEPGCMAFRIKNYKRDEGHLKLVNKVIKKIINIKEKQKWKPE